MTTDSELMKTLAEVALAARHRFYTSTGLRELPALDAAETAFREYATPERVIALLDEIRALQHTALVLKVIEGEITAGTCDWGECDIESATWRIEPNSREMYPGEWEDAWIPVCVKHTPEYEQLRAENERLRTENDNLRALTNAERWASQTLAPAALADAAPEGAS